MTILFFAKIREYTKASELRWDEPTDTLGELLRRLSARYGPDFQRWVLDGEKLGPAIIVTVNGRDVRHLDGVKSPLHPDDSIAIFPAIAGGARDE